MKKVFGNLFGSKNKNDGITIVSGLPRSGTSMMMKMLEAGGIEVLVDHIRKADEDNPKGYYEFEKVKKIKEDDTWLDDCKDKVVKMVSMLLYDLPSERNYKIVFMRRKMEEILASQRKMLERLGKNENDVNDEDIAKKFSKHLVDIKAWLAEQDNMDVLYVNYNEALNNISDNAQAINKFLDNKLNVDKMINVVDKNLYRQRK